MNDDLALYKNIRARRLQLGFTQSELAKKLGYADKSAIAKIEKGMVDLPQSKIKAFADVLETTPAELMGWSPWMEAFSGGMGNLSKHFDLNCINLAEDKSESQEDSYYTNPETAKIAQEIYENKELSLLFDAAKDAAPEDLQTVHTMLLALKKKERGE
ncbi:MAG: helix-turn-helix transcriptional regulator [Clostridium sp.]|nr:helix-turn-helix transcriptional regulator [Clostridium sp.]